MEELEVVAPSRVGRGRVWTEAGERISGVKMVTCMLMIVILVELGVLVFVEKIQERCNALRI